METTAAKTGLAAQPQVSQFLGFESGKLYEFCLFVVETAFDAHQQKFASRMFQDFVNMLCSRSVMIVNAIFTLTARCGAGIMGRVSQQKAEHASINSFASPKRKSWSQKGVAPVANHKPHTVAARSQDAATNRCVV